MYVAKSKTFHDKCGAMVADVFLKVKDSFEFNEQVEILHKEPNPSKHKKKAKTHPRFASNSQNLNAKFCGSEFLKSSWKFVMMKALKV